MLYLDNSSTTKVNVEVVHTMNQIMKEYWGNPSSLHRLGVRAEKVLKQSRDIVAKGLHVSSEEIIFTSGGTESSNLFIKGVIEEYSKRGKHIITTKIEHPAVSEVIGTYEKKGWRVTRLGVNEKGLISLEELKKNLSEETILVAIMHVNNESGAIQPVEEASKIVKEHSRAFFYVDGVQGFLKVPMDIKKTEIDGYGVSGHKIHGPKGTGALYLRKGLILKGFIEGGGQERGYRSGTENLPGIAGFAKAVQIYSKEYEKLYAKYNEIKTFFVEHLTEEIPEIRINSLGNGEGSPYIINCSLPKVRAENILHSLEESDIYISTGSACSGKDKGYSFVLQAMGIEEKYLKGSIRISMGLDYCPDEEDVRFFTNKLKETWNRLK